jgi:hypothetical protein
MCARGREERPQDTRRSDRAGIQVVEQVREEGDVEGEGPGLAVEDAEPHPPRAGGAGAVTRGIVLGGGARRGVDTEERVRGGLGEDLDLRAAGGPPAQPVYVLRVVEVEGGAVREAVERLSVARIDEGLAAEIEPRRELLALPFNGYLRTQPEVSRVPVPSPFLALADALARERDAVLQGHVAGRPGDRGLERRLPS